MTTQEETPVKELHLVTWNDFFPRRTDAAAELQTITLPQQNDRPSARAALERVLQADSDSTRGWPRPTRITRRSALAKRKLETLGREAAASPLLHLAAAELEVGNREKARQLLRQVLQANPRFEPAWLRMADAVDSVEARRFCLEQALIINRRNALARRRLEALTAGSARSERADRRASIEPSMEPRGSQNWLSRLRATLRKHAVPIAVIYLGVLFIAVAFALVAPQSRLVLYGVLLAVLIAHTALTWGHTPHALYLS
jgi:hypothetical protein